MTKRREFLKMGMASLASVPFAKGMQGEQGPALKTSKERINLGNDVLIDLLIAGDIFLGIGDVMVNGTQLRNGKRPMFVEITSPDGIHLTDYKIVDKTITKDQIKLTLKPTYTNTLLMEWMLHTVRNRQHISDWSDMEPKPTDDTQLELILLPIKRSIGIHNTIGFSYQYKYSSKTIPLYKIIDRGSWEINGSAVDNQFWMRNGVVDSIVEFKSQDQFYSTEWYLPGIANPNIFQYHPLQTQLQGFTYTSNNKGALVTWPTKVSHVRSLFEKWRHKNEIIHMHEHCQDLLHTLDTSPIEVLWYEAPLDRVGRANYYSQVRDLVHDELHAQIGMNRERISTYGVIEEWTEPDFVRYRDKGLKKLIDVGVETVFIPNQCQNAMNTFGLSNMCCTIDFKISETVGEDKLRDFCQAAKEANVTVEMWGNTALSTLTELSRYRDGYEKGIKFLPYKGSVLEVIDKAASPWIRNPSNAIEADHYTPRFCALNLRDKDIRAYWMQQWKYFYEHIGIGGIFLDSSFNMSSDKFHFRQWPEGNGWQGATMDQKDALGKYRPEHEPEKLIHTMYHEHLSWVVEMQRMGYHYCGEDMGVFGINRTGPDVLSRVSSLFLWQDCYCDFDELALRKAGYEPYDIFFKGLAYRTMWKVYWNIPTDTLKLGTEDKRAFDLLNVFKAVKDNMYNQVILENESGVLYSKGDVRILWCFDELNFTLSKPTVITNLVNGKKSSTTKLKAKPYQVYQWADL